MNLHNTSKIKTHKNKKLAANSVTLQQPKHLHTPVLLDEIGHYLMPKKSESYLDVTAGYGGHATLISRIVGTANLTLIDRDQLAIKVLEGMFPKATIHVGDFSGILAGLSQQANHYDMIMADLGISSPQIDDSSRGFSFLKDAPLDMRMDTSQGQTAAEAIARLSPSALTSILKDYGEEPRAQAIATAIKANLPTTTMELANIVKKVRPGYSKKHPATKTFQALRIFVNQELQQLENLLSLAPAMLAPGGRLAIITFHSLEDRLVKQRFKQLATPGYDSNYDLLTKKPVRPSLKEIASNQRSRSAKLRVMQRKQKQKG